MTAVLIVAHLGRAEAASLARASADFLRRRGHEVWTLPGDAAALGLGDLASERPPSSADLVLCLGGDGTVLRAVSLVDGGRALLAAVNVGQLGYLTEVEPVALSGLLERIDQGEHEVEERMLLEVEVDGVGLVGTRRWRALNEAVIEKRESGHTVRLQVHIDGAPFTTYAADGLIVATPTGSTAYSLSARGPVVSPNLRAMLLTPVSPHMLFDRGLVLAPDEVVEVEVIGHRSADLNIDGHACVTLEQGARVTCRPAAQVARFVRFGPRRFHQILKAKFGLADR